MKRLLTFVFIASFAYFNVVQAQCYEKIPYDPVQPGPNDDTTHLNLDDDELSKNITTGFQFEFYGNTYSSFKVSSNGFITFSSTDDGCCGGEVLPDQGTPNDLIAFCHDDLDPTNISATDIYHFTTGTSPNRKFVLNFDSVEYNSGNDTITTQLVLDEDSNYVEIQSKYIIPDDNTTMGIENKGGTEGMAIKGRNRTSKWTPANTGISNEGIRINNVQDDTINLENIKSSGNKILTNLTQDASSYQWWDCINKTEIQGATNQSFDPSSKGSYAVIVNQNGCEDTSSCTIISSTGIRKNTFGNAFTVAPNPTSGKVQVDLGKMYKGVRAKVFTPEGRAVSQKTLGAVSRFDLRLREPSGIYLLDIRSSSGERARVRIMKR